MSRKPHAGVAAGAVALYESRNFLTEIGKAASVGGAAFRGAIVKEGKLYATNSISCSS
jgi:hypothetical protein